jgi:hypothetical protein
MEKDKISFNQILFAGVLALGIIWTIRKIKSDSQPETSTFGGLISTGPDLTRIKYWNPTYNIEIAKNQPNSMVHGIKTDQAKLLSRIIYGSKKSWYQPDAESTMIGALQKSIIYKTQLSYLSKVFFDIYKESMSTYINSFADESTRITLENWANQLPSGIY